MSDKNYSFIELQNISAAIQQFMDNGEDYDKQLVFLLRMNNKKAKEAAEVIQEDFDQFSEENSQRYQQYVNQQVEAIKDNGGQIEKTQNGSVNWTNRDAMSEADKEQIDKALSEIDDEHSDLIDRLMEIEMNNSETMQKKIASVDFKDVPLDLFPDSISGAELPDPFLEFVVFEN
jgi:chromosome segregation ATPase